MPSWVRSLGRVVAAAVPWVVALLYVLTAREFRVLLLLVWIAVIFAAAAAALLQRRDLES